MCPRGRCQARRAYPVHALWQEEPYEVPFLSGGLCQGCTKCLASCPVGAIHVDGNNSGAKETEV